MKTVILCGGLGSRLGKVTRNIPKPMVRIGAIPIIEHIMFDLSCNNLIT